MIKTILCFVGVIHCGRSACFAWLCAGLLQLCRRHFLKDHFPLLLFLLCVIRYIAHTSCCYHDPRPAICHVQKMNWPIILQASPRWALYNTNDSNLSPFRYVPWLILDHFNFILSHWYLPCVSLSLHDWIIRLCFFSFQLLSEATATWFRTWGEKVNVCGWKGRDKQKRRRYQNILSTSSTQEREVLKLIVWIKEQRSSLRRD